MSCAQRSHVPYYVGGIRHGMQGVLQARIWLAIPPISPLLAIVLRLGVASLDSFEDLAYGDLRDTV
jgi:hypothetical protein